MPRRGEQTFILHLATAATADELREWMGSAPEGAQAIYAQGIDLPRAAPGVLLVREWIEQGLVVTHQRRAAQDPRQFQFMVERCGHGGGPVSAAANSKIERQKSELFKLLVQAARLRRVCPSNTEIGAALRLGANDRGRQRARYLVDRLRSEGAIEVDCPGAFTRRVVTIARGPWKGVRTAAPNISGGRG